MLKKDDVVKVIGNCNLHGFEIGYTVKIVRIERDGQHCCYNGKEHWYVAEKDMEKVN